MTVTHSQNLVYHIKTCCEGQTENQTKNHWDLNFFGEIKVKAPKFWQQMYELCQLMNKLP